MGKIRLYRLSDGIFSMKTLFYHLFHHGNVPRVAEQTIHLHDAFKRQIEQSEPALHFVKCAVDLFFNRAANIAYAVAEKTLIARLDDPGVRPIFIYIFSDDVAQNFSLRSCFSFHKIAVIEYHVSVLVRRRVARTKSVLKRPHAASLVVP